MILLDRLLVGGLAFVLRRIADAVDAELNDDTVWREELLAAQLRLEQGEITEREYAELEAALLARIREVRARREGPPAPPGSYRVTGVEATVVGDIAPPRPRRRRPPAR